MRSAPLSAFSRAGFHAQSGAPIGGEGRYRVQTLPGARLENSLLRTDSGDIVISIPSNLAVAIRAQNESIGVGKVVSEFPEISTAGIPPAATRPVVAQGSLNRGGPRFRLAASHEAIFLRRRK